MTRMRWVRLLVRACISLLLLSGCADMQQSPLYQDTTEFLGKATDKIESVAGKTSTLAQEKLAEAHERMNRYLAEKDVLKKFHDSANHSESALLAVLHQAGVSGAGGEPHEKKNGKRKEKTGNETPEAGGEVRSKAPDGRVLPALPHQYGGGYRWPLDAGIVSSEYGRRWGKLHKGIDIAADTGEPVYAVADGVVIYADNKMRGYGNVVVIRHDENMTSLYAHNSALKVHTGDVVKQGDLISLLGSTGHSTGPHTHFEIRDGVTPVSPRTLLPKGDF
ncbi:MAG: M23 family metallopeptidase, partial [Stenotrophobium sp.]